MRSGGSRPTLALLTMALLTIAPQTLFGSATIFVAPSGNDSNDGSRSAPKRSLQAAHDAVDAGGQVIALDAAGYNPFTITKSISITVASAGGAVIPASEVGITIAAGNSDRVSLRGLKLTGDRVESAVGIGVLSVGSLELRDCVISGYTSAGLHFKPAAAATLLLRNSAVTNNNNAILLPTNLSSSCKIIIEGCKLDLNSSALNLAATATAAHRVECHNTRFADNGDGVRLSGANNRIALQGCTFSANFIAINVLASGATVAVDGCAITGNTTAFNNASGGNLLSRGNNTVEDNVNHSSFSGTYPAK